MAATIQFHMIRLTQFYCIAISRYLVEISIFVSLEQISRLTDASVNRCTPYSGRFFQLV